MTPTPPSGSDPGAYRLDSAVALAFARFSGGYWTGPTARGAWSLTGGLVGLLLLSTSATLLLNHWNRLFFDSLESRDTVALSWSVLWFILIIAAMATIGVGIVFTRETLQVRWREWIVSRLLARWLSRQHFYRLQSSGLGPQNPEYRIADDSRWATEPLVDLGIGLVLALVNAAAFITILWQVGGSYTVSLGSGTQIVIPAYLVLVALAYGGIASLLTLKVGARLPGAVARRNEAEGYFRFGMMRLRDNADSVSLMNGGAGERRLLTASYASVVTCWMGIVRQHARLTWITNASGPMIPIVPLLFAAPKYISGELSLGQVTQLAAAFVHVQLAISWLVDHYGKIAEWYASARRIMELHDACGDAGSNGSMEDEDRAATKLSLQPDRLVLGPGEWLQVIGESSSGKSTLVRWLSGQADTDKASVESRMIVPQRDYLPPGTLREVLLYPGLKDFASDEALVRALAATGLAQLGARLDEGLRWDALLSRGERQRLAISRLLVHRPGSIVLDDALTALDEATQVALLQLLKRELPRTCLIWFGQRGFSAGFDRTIALDPLSRNSDAPSWHSLLSDPRPATPPESRRCTQTTPDARSDNPTEKGSSGT